MRRQAPRSDLTRAVGRSPWSDQPPARIRAHGLPLPAALTVMRSRTRVILLGAILAMTLAATANGSVSCGSLDFAPQSSNLAGSIRAGGVSCAIARKVAGASEPLRYRPYWPNGQFTPSPHRYRTLGFLCGGYRHATPFMLVTYRCTRGRAWVTFDRA